MFKHLLNTNVYFKQERRFPKTRDRNEFDYWFFYSSGRQNMLRDSCRVYLFALTTRSRA